MCAHRSALVSPEMVLLRPVIYDARRKPLRAAGFVRLSRTECLQGRPTGWRLVYSSYVYEMRAMPNRTLYAHRRRPTSRLWIDCFHQDRPPSRDAIFTVNSMLCGSRSRCWQSWRRRRRPRRDNASRTEILLSVDYRYLRLRPKDNDQHFSLSPLLASWALSPLFYVYSLSLSQPRALYMSVRNWPTRLTSVGDFLRDLFNAICPSY